MAKPTLGRGLGDLLGSNRVSAEPSAPMRPPGVGLRILIDGTQSPEAVARPAAVPAPPPTATVAHSKSVSAMRAADDLARGFAVLALAMADVALLGWTGHYVYMHAGSLNVTGVLFCTGSVLVAAFCGCSAARLLQRD